MLVCGNPICLHHITYWCMWMCMLAHFDWVSPLSLSPFFELFASLFTLAFKWLQCLSKQFSIRKIFHIMDTHGEISSPPLEWRGKNGRWVNMGCVVLLLTKRDRMEKSRPQCVFCWLARFTLFNCYSFLWLTFFFFVDARFVAGEDAISPVASVDPADVPAGEKDHSKDDSGGAAHEDDAGYQGALLEILASERARHGWWYSCKFLLSSDGRCGGSGCLLGRHVLSMCTCPKGPSGDTPRDPLRHRTHEESGGGRGGRRGLEVCGDGCGQNVSHCLHLVHHHRHRRCLAVRSSHYCAIMIIINIEQKTITKN